MANLTIEDRLEAIEQAVSKINAAELAERLAELIALVKAAQNQKPEKDFYSVAETAEILNRSEFQVRHWCKTGRIIAKKRACGHGPHKEWSIPGEEIKAYQSFGLRPPKAG